MKKTAFCFSCALTLSACASTAPEAPATVTVPVQEAAPVPVIKQKAVNAVKKQIKKVPEKPKIPQIDTSEVSDVSLQTRFDSLMRDIAKSKPNDSLFIAMDCGGYLQKEIVLDGIETKKPLKFKALLGYAFQQEERKSKKARIACTSDEKSNVVYEISSPEHAPRGVGFVSTEKNKKPKV